MSRLLLVVSKTPDHVLPKTLQNQLVCPLLVCCSKLRGAHLRVSRIRIALYTAKNRREPDSGSWNDSSRRALLADQAFQPDAESVGTEKQKVQFIFVHDVRNFVCHSLPL